MPSTAAPGHLSARAKAFFRAIIADFEVETAHREILQRACEAGDRADQARDVLNREGLTVRDRFDQLKPHPAVSIELDSRREQVRLLNELHLNESEQAESPTRTAAIALAQKRWKAAR